MKRKLISYSLSIITLSATLTSCSSTTVINTEPQGAKLYMNGEYKGVTPVTYSDTKIVGSETTIKLEMTGYDPLHTTLTRDEKVDVGAIIAGIFVFVPFLWTMEYNPTHTYELQTLGTTAKTLTQPAISGDRIQQLKEVKKLYDDGTLTKEEYETEKQKILNSK